MRYTSRGLRRSRGTDKWDVTLSHRDPLSGELVSTYHTVEARTRKKAERARDELILELERRGNAYSSKLTLAEFLDKFIGAPAPCRAVRAAQLKPLIEKGAGETL